MKKLIIIPLIVLILLTACQPGMVDNADSTESTTPSSSITPPTDSEVPPTQPMVQPTTSPTVDVKNGHVLIFNGPPQSEFFPDWWPTEGLIDHLYWVIEATKESILICDEPVIEYAFNDTHIFFNKKSEPTKVYATPIGDFKNHELIYESTYGDISDMNIEADLNGFLQFVAEEKKFIVLNMATGESTLLMEQYYINCAWMYGTGDGDTWSEIIEFEGKPTENDSPYTIYVYNYVTGVLELGDK